MKDPAIQFYCNDWLSSPTIMAMEPLQELAYFRMLLFMWQSGDCSIPNDAELMAKLTRTDVNTCSIVFEQAMNRHPTVENKLTNRKLYGLWEERQAFRKSKSEAGKASGKARRSKAKPNNEDPLEQTGTGVQLRSNETRTNVNSSSSSSSSSELYIPGDSVVIPYSLNKPDLLAAIGRWIAYLNAADNYKSIESNSPQEQELFSMLHKWDASPAEIELAISTAITGSWQNLRKPERGGKPSGNGQKITPRAPNDEDRAKWTPYG